jgi:16S rRNA (guanine527-N7)-methyltransferase
MLVVSEPPEPALRWPAEGIPVLGLGSARIAFDEFSFAVLQKLGPTSERYPRRTGVPSKRPLF